MTEKPVFSRKQIEEKQKKQRDEYQQKIEEMRKAFEDVAATPSGKKLLRYLFLICGGDASSIRRNKEGEIALNETLALLGARSVYENIRFSLTSATIQEIERHDWEEEK